MTREKDFLLPELVGYRDHVGNELGQCVRGHSPWFAAQIVTALVGHDNAKSCLRQRLDLFTPSIPELREAMQKDCGGPILGPRGHGVQRYAAIFKRDFLKGNLHGTRVYMRKKDSPRLDCLRLGTCSGSLPGLIRFHQNPGAPEAAGRILGAFTPKRRCAK